MRARSKLFVVTAVLIISLISVSVVFALDHKQNVSPPPDDSQNIGLTPFEQAELEKQQIQSNGVPPEDSVPLELLEERRKIERNMQEILESMLFTTEIESDGSVYWPSKAYTGLNLVLEERLGIDKFSKFVFTGDHSGRLMMKVDTKSDLMNAAHIVFSRTPELEDLEVATTDRMYKVKRDALLEEVSAPVESVSTARFDSVFEEIDMSKY